MRALDSRLKKLEQQLSRSAWDMLPPEVRERHTALVLRMFVYRVTGRPTEAVWRELKEMGPLPAKEGSGRGLSSMDVVMRLLSLVCREVRRNPENRDLAVMLRDAGLLDAMQFASCCPDGGT